jgi:hypothetical protein
VPEGAKQDLRTDDRIEVGFRDVRGNSVMPSRIRSATSVCPPLALPAGAGFVAIGSLKVRPSVLTNIPPIAPGAS